MSLNRKQRVLNEIFSATIAGVILLVTPLSLHAALTSTNYTIESPIIGNAGGSSMSSTNYSLTPSNGNTYTTSGVDPDEDDNEDDNEDSNEQGSKNRVKKKPNIQPIISAVLETKQVDSYAGNIGNAFTLRNNAVIETAELVEEQSGTITNATLEKKDETNSKRRFPLLANLVSGDFQKVLDGFGNVYSSLFSHFAARVAFFVWVLAFLYFIRVNTSIGRKYSPF